MDCRVGQGRVGSGTSTSQSLVIELLGEGGKGLIGSLKTGCRSKHLEEATAKTVL